MQFDCPSSVYRFTHDDTKRERLLKEMLKSATILQENEGKNKPKKGLASLMEDFHTKLNDESGKATRSKEAGVTLKDLAMCRNDDEACLKLTGDIDVDVEPQNSRLKTSVSELLRGCGHRISNLCENLQAADQHLATVQQETKLARADAKEHNIRILDRPEEIPAKVRAQNDRVISDFVAKHAHFDKLEKFKTAVDIAEGYDGLREVIPRRYHHHPNMILLNNNVLKDRKLLQAAIWTQMGNGSAMANSNTSISGNDKRARLHGRAGGLKVLTTGDCMRKSTKELRKERSAPLIKSGFS